MGAMAVALGAILAFAGTAGAQPPGMPGGMPDPRQMQGIPMPMDEVPAGTVVIRVVRDELTNTLQNVDVQLDVNGRVMKTKTDADGHATFPGVASGATVHASAMVGGQKLDSQPFSMPSNPGVRMLLLAGAGGSSAGGAPMAAVGAAPAGAAPRGRRAARVRGPVARSA